MYEWTSVIIRDFQDFLEKNQQDLYKSLRYVRYS